ncbi:hypothetical protein PIB30_033920 [Stylosanthes scabra]|uniref:Ribonuclease H1 N-terminal domain-containing protein n=1 Tax=Stylosanthes scabra TaxID=79078 RepID=A0ABU6XAD0_9FABA|nr:hypothetical protein [Stylosanthes scabra]
MSRAKYSHYAVKVGRVPGIYLTCDECDEQVHGYPYASFKGEQDYSFSVKLVCKEAGTNLEAHGCFSSDEGHARDDAAFTLLEMLLSRTGYSICDFNYRRMCALQQQLEDIQGTQGNQLAQRLSEKETECELLIKQIECFYKFLLL